jgi:hypothetical protein
MGIKKIKEGGKYNSANKTFLIESESELLSIENNYDCDTGDIAILLDGTKYIRHSNSWTGSKWAEYSDGSSGGGGGGGTTPQKKIERDVNFYDYDGTVVESYTKKEFANLTKMPDNPSHSNLEAQGWNWDLDKAKSHVQLYGFLDIGQMYITKPSIQNKRCTEIDMEITEDTKTIYLGLGVNGNVGVDWGDGNYGTISGQNVAAQTKQSHTYSNSGKYTLKIVPLGSPWCLIGNSTYGVISKGRTTSTENYKHSSIITAVRIGEDINEIGQYSFSHSHNLFTVTIPNNITQIGQACFNNCTNLISITVPKNAALANATFSYSDLKYVSLNYGITKLDGSFANCLSLIRVSLPNTINKLEGYSDFYCCYSLKKINIPSGITKLGANLFNSCMILGKIEIPNTVTSIDSQAFRLCYGLSEIHFKSTTPPTISNSNTFQNVPTDCKIYVPTGALSAYTSATNYPSASIYTYIEE